MTLPYDEGTWFAVPLRQGGYGVGVVARHSGEGVVLIYLFGPRRERPPQLREVERLASTDAVKVAQAGDLGLIEGSWPIIGKSLSWRRCEWPMPEFLRKDDITRTAWLVTRSDDNPNKVLSEKRVPFDTTGFERDFLSGAGAVEIKLTKLLS
jgi:Immunity protein 26